MKKDDLLAYVCPVAWIGPPSPIPPMNVGLRVWLYPRAQVGGDISLVGGGGGGTQFGRLARYSGTLYSNPFTVLSPWKYKHWVNNEGHYAGTKVVLIIYTKWGFAYDGYGQKKVKVYYNILSMRGMLVSSLILPK